jgi:hypothetical protein
MDANDVESDKEVKMDEQTLNEIDGKLSRVEWHLLHISDLVRQIIREKGYAERLINEVRDAIEKQIKEEKNGGNYE